MFIEMDSSEIQFWPILLTQSEFEKVCYCLKIKVCAAFKCTLTIDNDYIKYNFIEPTMWLLLDLNVSTFVQQVVG